jgi:hypothetical protein
VFDDLPGWIKSKDADPNPHRWMSAGKQDHVRRRTPLRRSATVSSTSSFRPAPRASWPYQAGSIRTSWLSREPSRADFVAWYKQLNETVINSQFGLRDTSRGMCLSLVGPWISGVVHGASAPNKVFNRHSKSLDNAARFLRLTAPRGTGPTARAPIGEHITEARHWCRQFTCEAPSAGAR